jgi:hypothetical protein
MNPFLRGALVFCCAVVVDFCWGFYIRRSAQGDAFWAATWGVMILMFSVFNILSWLGNHWMLAPLWIGSWLGTYWVIKWDHQKKVLKDGAENPDKV